MKRESRIKRHLTIRKHLAGTKECPRLAVFRSNKHIFAQIIDDSMGKTLVSVSDNKMDKVSGAQLSKSKKAYEIGKKLAEKALKFKIKEVVFDRGGFLYHGRIAELAKGAREGGLQF